MLATGARGIAGPRADANSGSFYHFFESKDALLQTVLATYLDLLEPIVLQTRCGGGAHRSAGTHLRAARELSRAPC